MSVMMNAAAVGNHPRAQNYKTMSRELSKRGFTGIDINMGCPEKSVVRSGQCSALIENKTLAADIITATKEGAGDLPVSVKTRIGLSTIVTEEWIGFLLEQGLDAITIHGRTRKEMSKVPAHWDEIAKSVKLRDIIAPETIIIGNGDVLTLAQGRKLAQETGVNGIMIGRGIFQNVWVFDESLKFHTKNDRLNLLQKHIVLYQETWGSTKNYHALKRFYKIYINGFDGAAQLRTKLMDTSDFSQALEILAKLLR